MKVILKTLLFLLIAVLLCQCEKDGPVVNISDDRFLNALIELGIDTNGDGYISVAEAEEVTRLEMTGFETLVNNGNLYYPDWETIYVSDISNISGIEMFINLETLILTRKLFESIDLSNCNKLSYLEIDAKLTNLDVSKNTLLTHLGCRVNQLTNLDVSKNTLLTYLNCRSNQLTNLDVSKNIALTYLDCSSNQLTNLDVSKNIALTYLGCSSNQVISLDLSNNLDLNELSCVSNNLDKLNLSLNTALEYLYCFSNQLTSLDVSKNTALLNLDCASNQITNLDVTSNLNLEYLRTGGNQLSSFDISKNPTLKLFDISGMPSLTKVCVWELPFPPSGVTLYITGSPKVYFTTDCN